MQMGRLSRKIQRYIACQREALQYRGAPYPCVFIAQYCAEKGSADSPGSDEHAKRGQVSEACFVLQVPHCHVREHSQPTGTEALDAATG